MATPGGLVDKQELIDAQLDTAHLGRVVNSKDASGAPINTSTNRTGGVNKTLDALESEYQGEIDSLEARSDAAIADAEDKFDTQRDQFNATFQAQFAYKRIGNISAYVGDTLPEADRLNSYQYPDDSGEWYGPVQNQTFPVTIPADPSTSSEWALVNAATQDWVYEGFSGSVNSISELELLSGFPDGASVSVASYHSAWAVRADGALGGGTFIYDSTLSENDQVVNFQSLATIGGWVRDESSEIMYSWGGGRPDNSPLDNDLATSRVIAYCSANGKGFKVKGTHEVTQGFDTTNVDFIAGYHRDHDGFKLNNSAGKTFIRWERPTVLRDLKIEGSSASSLIDEGSVGLSRAPYLNRAERVRIQNWGVGFHYHSSVDCHCKQVWLGGCHIGLKLDGYEPEIATAFSTTGSFTDSEFHGNYDGIVVGNMGAFNTAFIGFNLHNTVFENNSHVGFVCTNGEAEGVTYDSLELRNLVFTGYVWFENNALMYDFTRCPGVSWNGQVRNENGQPFVDNSDPARTSRFGTFGLEAGRKGVNPYYCSFRYNGVYHTNGGFYGSNQEIVSLKSFTDESTLAGGVELRQKLDWSVAGRLTELGFYVRAEGDSEAVEKMTLSRQGNLTITGSYAPFTGVHLFYSDTFINSGMAVKGISFDSMEINGERMEGTCCLTDTEDDPGCLGVVDSCEKLETGYLVAVAAVGDNSTLTMDGAVVDGDFTIGDYLSTSDQPGQLKAYHGESMKPVVMQVKGVRGGNLAYGYFK